MFLLIASLPPPFPSLQDIVDMRTERRRKGIYGPRPGVLNVVFVDDLNLPEKEKFFAQPPVEALRQLLANDGALTWCDCIYMCRVSAAVTRKRDTNPVCSTVAVGTLCMCDASPP